MGDKAIAKLILNDVPLIPGYSGGGTEDDFSTAAAEIGYPVMVKATAGGGGKGMRLVETADALPEAMVATRREAQQAFGDSTIMLEKALENPRHIEVQVFGDSYGNIIALGERECSIQRRHQKIIEESPSKAVTPELREKMCATAVDIARQLGYFSAGTVEFLLDDDGQYYFMEMNTRLQVEHPVTELVYGVDLVYCQLQVARGVSLERLLPGVDLATYQPQPQGHAIEARVYAEDPAIGFLPATGKIAAWDVPDNVRVDSGIRAGDVISPYYDPMIAKVITHGETRTDAIRKLDYALSKTVLAGIANNIAFLRRVLIQHEHLAGIISTHFLEDFPHLIEDDYEITEWMLIAAAIARQHHQSHWRNNPNQALEYNFQCRDEVFAVYLTPRRDGSFEAEIDEETFSVEVYDAHKTEFVLRINGHQQRVQVYPGDEEQYHVHSSDGTVTLTWLSPLPVTGKQEQRAGSLRSPMPGQVVQIAVAPGQGGAGGRFTDNRRSNEDGASYRSTLCRNSGDAVLRTG